MNERGIRVTTKEAFMIEFNEIKAKLKKHARLRAILEKDPLCHCYLKLF